LTTGSSLSSAITAGIAIGFLMFALAIAFWTWGLLDQFKVDVVFRLATVGLLILIFSLIASKLFSRVE
jgi:hypothetical protein